MQEQRTMNRLNGGIRCGTEVSDEEQMANAILRRLKHFSCCREAVEIVSDAGLSLTKGHINFCWLTPTDSKLALDHGLYVSNHITMRSHVSRVPAILCIDDEVLGLEIRKVVLEREGYVVHTAADGPTGIHIFRQQPIDAVVLDFAMPGMNGGAVAVGSSGDPAQYPYPPAFGIPDASRRSAAHGHSGREQG